MPVTQTVTCDCCGDALNSTSVLDCSILTHIELNGQITQLYFGRNCGCSDAVVAASKEQDHSTHVPPPSAPAEPAPTPPQSTTPAPDATPAPAPDAPAVAPAPATPPTA